MDKLEELFKMQGQLNDHTFKKQNLISIEDGKLLTSKDLKAKGKRENNGPNTDTNRWLLNYLEADKLESAELRNELLFKWWSKDKLDRQNINVEIIVVIYPNISSATIPKENASMILKNIAHLE